MQQAIEAICSSDGRSEDLDKCHSNMVFNNGTVTGTGIDGTLRIRWTMLTQQEFRGFLKELGKEPPKPQHSRKSVLPRHLQAMLGIDSAGEELLPAEPEEEGDITRGDIDPSIRDEWGATKNCDCPACTMIRRFKKGQ
jgi:hypothetical protein